MNVLLDTNVLLIWLGNTCRLTPTMSEVILSDRNRVFYSPLSVWECRIKAANGTLEVDDGLVEIIESKQFEELPFTSAHADETRNLPPIHKDPFDRGLVAQARVEGMTLLTTDALLPRYAVPCLLV